MLMSFIDLDVESYPRPCKKSGDQAAKTANILANRAVRNLESRLSADDLEVRDEDR